ncbi:pentatricopeptide repeat domain-containing protein [Spizellomyces punctatus DAOM BR117]|uniref:Pentatricopeptide repeat domain-containing protein n=1 Tax=Spizellomyces punctatus (strain DAOM BR117) TaxID=645134 RepID=A0A0L0HIL9_SPIPD|nr:pentatricopeptide repeat domain-containing protein [Spizellomyces punctatus DAOM BR117]KND01291.1 pentatricopeptide repeat domain-containing protein [Spizellomyces punctatus DAOM BR117]|eukprot:XP_016609330.1 pentatricopeptide repeat domain-containing protein [Spizellomyces punctatus DAOM BR117]
MVHFPRSPGGQLLRQLSSARLTLELNCFQCTKCRPVSDQASSILRRRFSTSLRQHDQQHYDQAAPYGIAKEIQQLLPEFALEDHVGEDGDKIGFPESIHEVNPEDQGMLKSPRSVSHFTTMLQKGRIRKARKVAHSPVFQSDLARLSQNDIERLLRLTVTISLSQRATNITKQKDGEEHSTKATFSASLLAIRRVLLSTLITTITNGPSDSRHGSISASRSDNGRKSMAYARELIAGRALREFLISPGPFDYQTLITAQAAIGELDGAQETVKWGLDFGVKLPLACFQILASERAKRWHWDGVRWVWQAIQRSGAPFHRAGTRLQRHSAKSAKRYVDALSAFVQLHVHDMGEEHLSDFLKRHDLLDMNDIGDIIWSRHPENRKPQAAVLKDLLRTFSSYPSRAMDVFALLRAFTQPSSEDCAIVISSVTSENDDQKILDLDEMMRKDAVSLDTETRSIIETARVRVKRRAARTGDSNIRFALRSDPPKLKLACQEFYRAREEGRVLRAETMSDLITFHVRADRKNEALEFYHTMKSWSQTPSRTAYGALISSALKNSHLTRVWTYYDEMVNSEDPEKRPNARICSRILAAISKSLPGDLRTKASKVEEEWMSMVEDGVKPNVEMWNVVLSAHASAGDLKVVLKKVAQMSEEGILPDEFTLHAIIDAHIKSRNIKEAKGYMEEFIAKTKVQPLRATINLLVANSADTASARDLVIEAEQRFGIMADSSTQSALAFVARTGAGSPGTQEEANGGSTSIFDPTFQANMLLSKEDDPTKFGEILNRPGVKPDVVTYTTLVGKHLHHGQLAEVEQLYARMRDDPATAPRPVTFHVLIHHFSQLGDVVNMRRYIRDMESAGVVPLPKTYASLINGFSRAGDLVTAEDFVLKHMVEHNVAPDVVVMNALMNARVRAGDLVGARNWRRVMMKKWKIVPNAVTFQVLIDGYCQKGTKQAMNTAVKLLEAMEKDRDPRVRPSDHIPYTTLIAGYGKIGDMESALARFTEMLAKNIKPGVETHNAMIGAYCAVGDFRGAQEWFERAFLNNHQEGNTSLHPDSVTFFILIKAHADANDADGVAFWLDAMNRAGIVPSPPIRNVVFGWLCRTGRTEQATEWFEIIRKSGHVGSRTVVAALEAFAKKRDPESAEEWFSKLTSIGAEIDVKAWTALADAYGKSGDLDGVKRTYERMLEVGCEPSAVTYLTLLDAYAKKGHERGGLEWIQKMTARGVAVGEEHVVALMDARERAKNLEGVRECWSWILNRSWPGRNGNMAQSPNGANSKLPEPRSSERAKSQKPAEPTAKPLPLHRAQIPEAAACVYLDALGRHSTHADLQEAWREIQTRAQALKYDITENQVSSLVEALVRLGQVDEAVQVVLTEKAVGQKVLVGLIGGVKNMSGLVQARATLEQVHGVVGQDVARRVRETVLAEV